MTSSYQQRRRDPQPLGQGWELPVLALTAAALTVVAAALAGLALASVLFGGGWVWPDDTASAIAGTLAGIATGHPGRGLPAADRTRVPDNTWVYACVAVGEAVAIAACIGAVAAVAAYRRPGDVRAGFATRTEAARALGVGRLRSVRRLIRPDLYGGRGQR